MANVSGADIYETKRKPSVDTKFETSKANTLKAAQIEANAMPAPKPLPSADGGAMNYGEMAKVAAGGGGGSNGAQQIGSMLMASGLSSATGAAATGAAAGAGSGAAAGAMAMNPYLIGAGIGLQVLGASAEARRKEAAERKQNTMAALDQLQAASKYLG